MILMLAHEGPSGLSRPGWLWSSSGHNLGHKWALGVGWVFESFGARNLEGMRSLCPLGHIFRHVWPTILAEIFTTQCFWKHFLLQGDTAILPINCQTSKNGKESDSMGCDGMSLVTMIGIWIMCNFCFLLLGPSGPIRVRAAWQHALQAQLKPGDTPPWKEPLAEDRQATLAPAQPARATHKSEQTAPFSSLPRYDS